MNCATITPDERYAYDKERSHDRRTSRGLASCLRGESEEYYDYEAEGKTLIYILLFSENRILEKGFLMPLIIV